MENNEEDIETAPLKPTEILNITNKRITCSCCALLVLVLFSFMCILLALIHGMNGGIEASIQYRDSKCITSKYGCCEVFKGCNIKNDHIDYSRTIFNNILANNNLKSDCLSLHDIITKYNLNYNKNNCGEYGCCPVVKIDTKCDDTIRKTFLNGNNFDRIDEFKNNTSLVDVKISKIDEEGSNCIKNRNLLFWDIINSYKYDYPKKLTLLEEFIQALCVFIGIICFIICITSGNRRGRCNIF